MAPLGYGPITSLDKIALLLVGGYKECKCFFESQPVRQFESPAASDCLTTQDPEAVGASKEQATGLLISRSAERHAAAPGGKDADAKEVPVRFFIRGKDKDLLFR
ncbi:hypothetical protein AVEN_34187-1 [Araneus ventricosus]|uniref:Uncharacterized protein n=1 Tax=Araneus ventricosus TaxID=182803 RepID=A0A4Y2VY87_ARAVE|nr:hypothetical protein AVEN_34187-1 [Araneus ventricosus]